MYIAVGFELYGRVRVINNVSIATRFATFQHLPIYPLESYYLLNKQEAAQVRGVPLLAWLSTTSFQGIPLSRLDKLSVVYAYVRTICAVIFAMGFTAAVLSGLIYLEYLLGAISPGQPLEGGWTILAVVVAVFTVACVIGLLMYVYPRMSQRELQIRQACAEHLGIAIDPAIVTADAARKLGAEAHRIAYRLHDIKEGIRVGAILQLIDCRCQIAQHPNVIVLRLPIVSRQTPLWKK